MKCLNCLNFVTAHAFLTDWYLFTFFTVASFLCIEAVVQICRSLARSKIELFITRANGWKLLTITKINSTQDPAKVLDPILIIIKMVYKLNGLSKKTSPKTKLSKTKKYNVSIVQHLNHSKNESLRSQDHT